MQYPLEYHLRELSIARDQSLPNHLMPPIKPHHKRILDIGCGMGQTLIAANFPPEVMAYGIDHDATAIEAGLRIAPPNVHLAIGVGEKIPFPDLFFDLAVCRVALPYMHIATALSEIYRVLAPGGETWLLLHSKRMYRRRAIKSLKEGNLKDLLNCGFIWLNSLLVNATGKQLTIKNLTETFQTEPGIRRALTRSGFESVKIDNKVFFVAECRKPL